MNASDRSVTQQDRVANPQKVGSVRHVSGLQALRKANVIPMTPTARRLFEWTCLNSKRHGCTWTNWGFQKWAAKWKVHPRTVRKAREELEKKGILRSRIIERYGILPNGDMARNRTQLLYPIVPGTTRASYELDRIRSGPDRPLTGLSDRPRDSFSDLDQKGGSNIRCAISSDEDPERSEEREPSSRESHAAVVFERWRQIHDPELERTDDAEGWYQEILRLLMGWFEHGLDLRTCIWAVEGAAYSPMNRDKPGMQSLSYIFGSKARILALSNWGQIAERENAKLARIVPASQRRPTTTEVPLNDEVEMRMRAHLAAMEGAAE
jgi:hypothetical protein